MSSAEPRTGRRERPVASLETAIPPVAERATAATTADAGDFPKLPPKRKRERKSKARLLLAILWKRLLQGGAWIASGGLHLSLIVLLAFFISSAEKPIPELEFQEVEIIGEGPDLELGPGFDTELDVPDSINTIETTTLSGFGSAPEIGIPDLDMPAIDVGASSVSPFATTTGLVGGGGGGNPGRIGEIDRRVAAGGGNTVGDLRISLAWEDMNDLDIHVLTPDQEEIYFGMMQSTCGGVLDVDANASFVRATAEPVENIVWEVPPRDGEYLVVIHYFKNHPNQPVTSDCDVLMMIGDQKQFLTIPAIRPRQDVEVATFEIQNGQLTEFTPNPRVREGNERGSGQGSIEDEKREATRQQFAQEALDEAIAIEDPHVRGRRLERVIERFPGTPAAEAAQMRLDEIESM